MMHKFITPVFFAVSILTLVPTCAVAEIIDPEKYIERNGYQSEKIGDDGKTRLYSFTERTTASRIARLEGEIEKLPKHMEIYKVCDLMRGSAKAILIQQRGVAIDVAATNYGYNGSTITCVLKYMHENKVGTQLVYMNKGVNGMYMVIVTD